MHGAGAAPRSRRGTPDGASLVPVMRRLTVVGGLDHACGSRRPGVRGLVGLSSTSWAAMLLA